MRTTLSIGPIQIQGETNEEMDQQYKEAREAIDAINTESTSIAGTLRSAQDVEDLATNLKIAFQSGSGVLYYIMTGKAK